jgi:hypothetical protein
MKRRRPSPSIPGQQGGKQSGQVRRERSCLRRRLVVMVHEQLKPAYQNQPFSTQALDALRDEYLKVLNGEEDNVFARMLYALCPSLSPEADAWVQSMRPLGSRRIISEPRRRVLQKPAVPPDQNKILLHWAIERDISNLSDTDRQFLKQVSHDTLLKDLKALGIRSRHKQNLLQNRQNNQYRYLRGAMCGLIHYRLGPARRSFLEIAEFFWDQYHRLLRPEQNKSLTAGYTKMIDRIRDGGDEQRRHFFKWTMSSLDQLSAAGRKVMTEISCETFFKDLEDVGLIFRRKQ